jgi:hypothetical protein
LNKEIRTFDEVFKSIKKKVTLYEKRKAERLDFQDFKQMKTMKDNHHYDDYSSDDLEIDDFEFDEDQSDKNKKMKLADEYGNEYDLDQD